MQIKIGNYQLAIGGEWFLSASKADAAEFLARHKKSMVMDGVVAGERVLGAFDQVTGRGKVYAGAMLVASVEPDCVVFHQIDEDNVWFAAIKDGIPLADFDKVTTWAIANQLMTDVVSFNPTSTVVGTLPSSSLSIDAILAKVDPKKASGVVLRNKRRQTIRLLLTILALFGMSAGIAVTGMSYVEGEQKRSAYLANLTITAQQKADSAKKTTQYRALVERAVAEQRYAYETGTPLDVAARIAYERMKDHALMHRGWVTREIECTQRTGECTHLWVKSLPGASILEVLGIENGPTHYAEVQSGQFRSKPFPTEFPVSLVRKTTNDALFWFSALNDQYSRYGVSITVSPKVSEAFVAIPSPPEGLPQPKPVHLGKYAEFNVVGGYRHILALSEKIKGVGLKTEKIVVTEIDSGKMGFNISGKVLIGD